LKEQLLQLQKIAKELNDAIVGLQAEWAWTEQKTRDALQPVMVPHREEFINTNQFGIIDMVDPLGQDSLK
jgi:hypothetical protein